MNKHRKFVATICFCLVMGLSFLHQISYGAPVAPREVPTAPRQLDKQPEEKTLSPQQVLAVATKNCKVLNTQNQIPVLCSIEEMTDPKDNQRHPLLVFTFPDIATMQALAPTLAQHIGNPFCIAHNDLGHDAYILANFMKEQGTSVVSCKTQEESPIIPWGNSPPQESQKPLDEGTIIVPREGTF